MPNISYSSLDILSEFRHFQASFRLFWVALSQFQLDFRFCQIYSRQFRFNFRHIFHFEIISKLPFPEWPCVIAWIHVNIHKAHLKVCWPWKTCGNVVDLQYVLYKNWRLLELSPIKHFSEMVTIFELKLDLSKSNLENSKIELLMSEIHFNYQGLSCICLKFISSA